MTTVSVSSAVEIRWLIRRDLPDVLRIEDACFDYPWTEEDFLTTLRQRTCIGMVAEHRGRIVGFMIYELRQTQIYLLDFAVSPAHHRQRTGSQLIERLMSKLSAKQDRKQIVLQVRETNLPAQLFFRHHGFRAISILKRHYKDTAEDAYVLRYHKKETKQERPSSKSHLP